MEYFSFILVILALIFILYLLSRIERRTKHKWRKNAYDLLEKEIPDQKEVINTIKYLRLYGGRLRKNKEFMQLIARLQDKLDTIEKK